MRQNIYVILAFVAIFALGMWGQYLLYPATFWTQFADLGYQILMLFVLEGDWTVQVELPWQLDVARYQSPLILVTSIIFVATRGSGGLLRPVAVGVGVKCRSKSLHD